VKLLHWQPQAATEVALPSLLLLLDDVEGQLLFGFLQLETFRLLRLGQVDTFVLH